MKYYFSPEKLLDFPEINRIIERAFAELAGGVSHTTPENGGAFPPADLRRLPDDLRIPEPDRVKIMHLLPENPAGTPPTMMALSVFIDPRTGLPVALMDATGLTAMRNGAAGAVAAKYLCPRKEIVLGLIGAGRKAAYYYEAIANEFLIREVKLWSRDEKLAETFRQRYPAVNISICNPKQACDCDLLVTSTPSRKPVIKASWVHEGTHINAMGADAPGKQELDPTLLALGKVVVDDRQQAIHSGEINIPVAKGLFSPDGIAGTLGEVILGKKVRDSDEQITIFDSTGLAVQDLAIASLAMKYGKSVEVPFPA